MAQQEFPQLPYKYGDGLRGAAIAQTRDGKDELITPVALWERNKNNGLYLPPGLLDDADVAKPRVEATLTGSNEATAVVYGNFGQRVYFGKNGGVGEAIGPSGRIPWSLQKGKVYFWITNTRDRASNGGVRLHWFLGDQIRDDIPYTTLPDIPARATMGICVGGEPFSEGANGEIPLLWVPNHGGDGVIVSVYIGTGDIGDINVYVTGIEGGL